MADGKLVKAPDGSLWRIGYDAEGKVASFEPDASSEPAESLPRTTEEMAAQDALMAPPEKGFLETVSGAGAKMVPQALERIKALYPGNWPGIAEALLRPGTNEDVLPGASTGPSTGLKFINEVLKRPALTQAGGSLVGGAAGLALSGGNPVAAYTGAQGGGELMNQLNQSVLGTAPDVPWQEDKENLIAGAGVDALTAGALKPLASKALKGTRQKVQRAERPGELGALMGTPKGTTPLHEALSRRMTRQEAVLAKPDIDPLAGIDPSAPDAFAQVSKNILRKKEALKAEKNQILRSADSSAAPITLTPDDLDIEVRATNSAGYPVTDDAVAFAKTKLGQITKQTGEWKPGGRSELVDNRLVGVSDRQFTPTELAEEIRRQVIDEKKRLGLYDATTQARATVSQKELAQMQTQRQGLDLLEDMMNRKLNEAVPSQRLPEVNAGISALIDFEEQVGRANVSALGNETVPHGAGQPGKLADLRPGWFDRAVNTILPGGKNRRATAGRTEASSDAQVQMIGPAQDVLRMKRGDTSFAEKLGMKASDIVGMFGNKNISGEGAISAIAPAVMSPTTLTPDQVPQLFGDKPQAPMQFQRDSNVIRQMPEQFAATVQQAAFETLLKQTGSPEVASSVAHRMSREALQIAASPSDAERAEGIAAIAKTLPQAFLPGEYPDEMDGTVVQPTSKLQLEDNAKAKLQAGQVDSITYAKQKQEAFKSGPSRIIIRKSGQLTPAQPASNPNAVMMQANTPNY